jgi:hypothetical protein
VGRVDVAEGTFQGVGREFGDLASQFDPGRTRTDDGERQQLLPEDRIPAQFS